MLYKAIHIKGFLLPTATPKPRAEGSSPSAPAIDIKPFRSIWLYFFALFLTQKNYALRPFDKVSLIPCFRLISKAFKSLKIVLFLEI